MPRTFKNNFSPKKPSKAPEVFGTRRLETAPCKVLRPLLLFVAAYFEVHAGLGLKLGAARAYRVPLRGLGLRGLGVYKGSIMGSSKEVHRV